MRRIGPLLLLFTVCLSACAISDDDRCPAGWEYRSDVRLCYLIEDEKDASASDASAPSGGDFGDTCGSNSDCAGDTDYCLKQPNADEGYCTVENCSSSDCPADFSCCNCLNLGLTQFCARQADVDAFLGAACLSCN